MRVTLRILGVTLATAGALAPLPIAARTRAPQELITVTGVLDGWNLDVDGIVYLRLLAEKAVDEGEDEKSTPPGGMWFQTPPDRSDDLQIEQMTLGILIATGFERESVRLTVTAKQERQLDGSTPEKALPLESIGRL